MVTNRRLRIERRKARLSVLAASSLIAGICAFALLIVFAQRPLGLLLADGVSVYLVLMVALAVLVWLLTFAYMRAVARLDAAELACCPRR